MLVDFDKWWQEDGKMIDPDTEDVPWFDKRKGLAELAFEAGIKCGMEQGQVFTPPALLSDYDIQMIHAGLLIPSAKAILSMSREIRKWRGDSNPDLI